MINAPQGMAAGLPAAPGASSCAVAQAPPPLVGGGLPSASAGASLPAAPPLSSFGTPVIPSTGAATAALGATTIGGATPIGGAMAAPAATAAPGAAGTTFSPSTPNIIGVPAPVAGINGPPLAGTPTDSSLGGIIASLTGGVATAGALVAGAAVPGAMPAGAAPAGTVATGAAAAPRPLTSLAPGGSAQDAALVERTLGVLRQSPAGAQIVDRLLAVGARVNVISDQEFAAMGHKDAHAFYDPKIDTMFLRRSNLADNTNVQFAAVALAHEGTHLLDDVAKLSDPFIAEITQRVAAAGGLGTAQGAAVRDQAMFELTMIKETRAFLFAGQVARELKVSLPQTDPTSTAIAGSNDQATFNAVWQRLLRSSYNEQGRTATPRNL